MKLFSSVVLAWLCFLACESPFRAHAALLSQDDPTFGPSALTFDTRTGLRWLDLPLSYDLSYNQAEAAMLPGGLFYGFRHATAPEVLSLYNSAGFTAGFCLPSSSAFPNLLSFFALVGADTNGVHGISGTLMFGDAAAVPHINWGYTNGVPGYFVDSSLGEVGSLYYGLNVHDPSVGNWLVAVPEPAVPSLLLMMGALIGFAGRIRLARKRSPRR